MSTMLNSAALLLMIVVAITDAKRRIIPDACAFGILTCGLLKCCIGVTPWLFAAVGAGCMFLITLLAAMLLGGIGAGDVKLCSALGALLGAADAISSLIFALVALVVYGKATGAESLPGAPFIAASAGLILLIQTIIR